MRSFSTNTCAIFYQLNTICTIYDIYDGFMFKGRPNQGKERFTRQKIADNFGGNCFLSIYAHGFEGLFKRAIGTYHFVK